MMTRSHGICKHGWYFWPGQLCVLFTIKFGQVNFMYSPPSQTQFSPIQNKRHTWLESPFSCDTLWIWRFWILQNKNTWWVQLLWSQLKTLKSSWNHTLVVTLFTLVSLGWKYLSNLTNTCSTTQSASAMMTRSHGICKHGWYCVRLRVPMALPVMSTTISTCKCKDHIQTQHRKHTGICHHSRRENTVNDHRRDIHLRVHIIRSKCMSLPNTLEDHRSEPHNWASAHTHTKSLLSVHFPGTTQKSAQHQQDIHSAHTTSHDVTRCIHVVSVLVFLFLLLPVSSSCFRFPNPLLTWVLSSKRFADLFRVRNWGSMFFEGHEKLWFQEWMYLQLFVKRFLFKKKFKIAHVFQLEMWITPKS